MTSASEKNWQEEFGIATRKPPSFFSGKGEIGPTTPQGHLLRRAFDVLKVDGVLCVDHSPLAYFKLVKRISRQAAFDLHRRFWNHSGASLLVLVTDDRVHVYSGMIRPNQVEDTQTDLPSLVTSIDRVAGSLKEFIIAVESGEFFHRYHPSFDPAQRVDRVLLDNLQNTRAKLGNVTRGSIPTEVLDALLCRLVFTCYLFDRNVIDEGYLNDLGIQGATDLRSLLGFSSRTNAKDALYKLFNQLKDDFNGDLFSLDLNAEKDLIQETHIATLNDFFQGTNVASGQQTLFWPYDFEFIPIETISAIYERFLPDTDEQRGAFYTPRFLAEVVLDTALDGMSPLIGKKFFDPACGSGIFLVGVFNRIAEEWRRANPTARNDKKSRELMQLLQQSLFGVDVSPIACRITAFSLYLAYLDHLTPPDIRALQEKKGALPCLVVSEDDQSLDPKQGNICPADFFARNEWLPTDVSLIIGNPPWGSIAKPDTPAGKWCSEKPRPLPDNQIAAAFIWKAVEHVAESGRICFVLPHGVLFNHGPTAIPFQKAWVNAHAIERVINLADLRFLLFEKAIHPAVVVSYKKKPPNDFSDSIEYWTPKADWTVTQAEVITIAPQDRMVITVGELSKDLASPDAPQIWKRGFWATPRDWRLLDRLFLLPRLENVVRKSREPVSSKRWLMAEGFQPVGPNDDPDKATTITLPSTSFIRASSKAIDLFLLPSDCKRLESVKMKVRSRSNKNTQVFRGPHVLVTKGFNRVAFADFDVSFQHALRGINGPQDDHDLLAFLAAYLRSSLARYFLFHTSSSWGIYRPEVHVEEVLRVPFPLPDQLDDPKRSWEIVREVSRKIADAANVTRSAFLARDNQIQNASNAIDLLVNEYFGVLPMESELLRDTLNVIEPSIQPTLARMPVATVKPVTADQCDIYLARLIQLLSGWGKRSGFTVRGEVLRSESLGIGITVLEKVERIRSAGPIQGVGDDLIHVLDKIRKAIPRKHTTLDVVRGVVVFDGNRLYVVKPIGHRFWTLTAAMNDADQIAATILAPSLAEEEV